MWSFCQVDRYDSSVSITRLSDTRTHVQNNKSAIALTHSTHAHPCTHRHKGRAWRCCYEHHHHHHHFLRHNSLLHYTRSCSCLTCGHMAHTRACVCVFLCVCERRERVYLPELLGDGSDITVSVHDKVRRTEEEKGR